MRSRFFSVPGTIVAAASFAWGVASCGAGAEEGPNRCLASVPAGMVVPANAAQRPLLGVQHNEPAFGPCVQRVSDHQGHNEVMAVHVGARAQAFNADGSAVLLRKGQVLRLSDRKLVGQMPAADTGWVWSNDVATLAFAMKGNQIVSFDFQSNVQTAVQTFARYERLLSESGLWLPSSEGTWALGGQLSPHNGQAPAKELFLWNPKNVSSFSALQVAADSVGHVPSPRWLQTRPDGQGFVVAWASTGLNKAFAGIELYDQQGVRVRQLRPAFEICDLALDEKRSAWIVCAQPPAQDESTLAVTKHSLADTFAPPQILLRVSVEHNVELSCVARGTSTCALSAVGATQNMPLSGEIAVFSLNSRAESPQLWRLAHHNSSTAAITTHTEQVCPLEASSVLPHATLDRRGKRVLFGSNWVSNCFAELYLIDYR